MINSFIVMHTSSGKLKSTWQLSTADERVHRIQRLSNM